MAKRDPHLVAFGVRLAALRKARKLTQESLAARAKISAQYVSDIETGTVNPSLLVLRAVARALDLSLARMLAESAETDIELAALLNGRTKAERSRALAFVRLLFAPMNDA